jgi:hypothetical protein
MIKDDLQEGGTTATLSEDGLTNFEGKNSFQEGTIVQEILSSFLELKREVITLNREVSKNQSTLNQVPTGMIDCWLGKTIYSTVILADDPFTFPKNLTTHESLIMIRE